jgi:hypothetical protein
MKNVLVIAGLTAIAGAASADFTISGPGPFDSTVALGGAGNFSSSIALNGIGSQLIGGIRVRGTLTEVNTGTFASEARWNLANTSKGYNASHQVFTQGNFTGSLAGDRTFGVLQWWSDGDTWRGEAFESFDDSGVDARWTNVQFDYLSATVINLGTYASGSAFDIDTAASNYDTELALYTASGTLLAQNDDAIGLQSRINAGVLADGAYYIVVGGFDSVFANFNAAGGAAFGNHNLNINGASVGGGATVTNQLVVYSFNVPTPGSLALLGLGGLVAARRRR